MAAMNWARWCVIGYLCLVPQVFTVLPIQAVSNHDLARASELVLMALCSISLLTEGVALPSATGAAPYKVLCLSSIVLAVTSIACSSHPLWAFMEAATFCGLLCVALVMSSSVGDERALREAKTLTWALAIQPLSALMLVVAGLSEGLSISPFNLPTGHIHPRFYNHAQTVSILLIAWLSTTVLRTPFTQGVAFAGMAMQFALLFYSGGRATIIAIFGAAFLGSALSRRGWKLFGQLSIGAALGCVVYAIVFWGGPKYFNVPERIDITSRATYTASFESRIVLWRQAISDLGAHPFLGTGPMHFANSPGRETAHPHNFLLQFSSEWGMPQFFILIGVLGAMLFALIRKIRTAAPPRGLGGTAALVTCLAVVLDAQFSGNLVMPVSQVWIAAAAGMCARWWMREEPTADFRPPLSLRGNLAMIQISLLAAGMVQLHARWQAPDRYIVKGDIANPRFWTNGWIFDFEALEKTKSQHGAGS